MNKCHGDGKMVPSRGFYVIIYRVQILKAYTEESVNDIKNSIH